MDKYLIYENSTLFDALKKMDNSHVKFLIVVNNLNRIIGILTDGDIRRTLLNGKQLTESVVISMNKKFITVLETEGLADILDKFKNEKIAFLPVVSVTGVIRNIITRRTLHVILLKNIKFNMDYDFCSINENELEHEIYSRPWGFYKTTVLNDYFQSKVIYINQGQSLSLQSHIHREEYWTIVHGKGEIQIGDSIHSVHPGESFFIPKGCKHRLTNTSDIDTLILTEVQLGDYFGEDDILRFDDKYGRQ